jgi:hypothetical protein
MTDGAPGAGQAGSMDIEGKLDITFSSYRKEFYAVGWYGGSAPAYVRQESIRELNDILNSF